MGKMYDGEIYEKVSQWFDGHREEMTEDIKRLVRIPSIACHGKEIWVPYGEPGVLCGKHRCGESGLGQYDWPVESSGCGAAGGGLGL